MTVFWCISSDKGKMLAFECLMDKMYPFIVGSPDPWLIKNIVYFRANRMMIECQLRLSWGMVLTSAYLCV